MKLPTIKKQNQQSTNLITTTKMTIITQQQQQQQQQQRRQRQQQRRQQQQQQQRQPRQRQHNDNPLSSQTFGVCKLGDGLELCTMFAPLLRSTVHVITWKTQQKSNRPRERKK